MEQEIQELKKVVEKLSKGASFEEAHDEQGSVSTMLKYMIDERERTNKMLKGITERLKKLEVEISSIEETDEKGLDFPVGNREVPLSNLDSRILELAQAKGMVCADDVQKEMNYRGRNAACARLNRLYRAGLLDRFQLGHKVYFKYDAGKTTNTLIISPPQ
ncbi:MAG: hypothetical protein KGH71_00510 [Candidatus Micrarchaeota archaeon]|nr:hypothetical protein [Candidatus Micrarchaeota archaeon]